MQSRKDEEAGHPYPRSPGYPFTEVTQSSPAPALSPQQLVSSQLRNVIQQALHPASSLPVAVPPPMAQALATAMSQQQLPVSGPSQQPLPTTSTHTSSAVALAVSAAATAVSASASSQFQRLKVEDALSYLDQVKLQFGNHPQVYNDFLDIMKEFKSQSIDTPGVISRVSNLFKGHPDLIVGFNTFLPPGFKIEVHQNEINISGPAQHSHQLQRIAQQHNSAAAAALAAAAAAASSSSTSQSQTTGASAAAISITNPSSSSSSSSLPNTRGSAPSPSSTPSHGAAASASSHSVHQPVEFNHAINYVNKIKNRFQHHPDIYKAFLEILHTYQKEQRIIKEGGTPSTIPLSETEVYSQVSKLFQNQEDLLSEFGQFLPDATASFNIAAFHQPPGPPPPKKPALSSGSKVSKPAHSRKGSQSGGSTQGAAKKPKSSAKDVLAEAAKHTNYVELALFDKIRKAVRNQDVFENFLRCLVLFNEEIISRQELVHLVTPFLGKVPELLSSFKTLLGFKEPGLPEQLPTTSPVPPYPPKDRVTEFAAEIDFNSLKRHGASYRALPKTYVQPKCSGRSPLCCSVLNDTWVSFPMWSEDTTFQGTRKTQYEEYIFRCEDERFELDVVLETNLATIRVFEALQKKLVRMSPEEAAKFTLDNGLGGTSEVLQRKAIHRIYGDKAPDIIEGLQKSPSVAVPIVLKRLKAKQEEWQEAQKSFNKSWRDQLEKYYLKSLDHQGINFKALDTRAMRSKSLIGEVESIFDERQEQLPEGASISGPHLTFPSFPEECCVFDDAVSLVMYYLKRASSVQRDEAVKIRSFLTQTLAQFFFYPRVAMNSEDDLSPESDLESMDVDTPQNGESEHHPLQRITGGNLSPDPIPHFTEMDDHLIFTNNSLYTLFRLIQFLCERLNRIYQHALRAISEDKTTTNSTKSEQVAIKLGLRKPPDIHVDEFYPTFLNLAKNFMEGNIDSTSYEDTCREMFGVHAFVVFTIDRLVQNIVRQLHTVVADDNCYQVMELYTTFVEQISPFQMSSESRTGLETTYQKRAEGLLLDENCFKIMFCKANRTMTIELMDTDESQEYQACPEMKKWQSYVEKYSKPEEDASPELRDILAKRKVFLRRNHRRLSLAVGTGEEEDEAKLVRLHLPQMEIIGAIEFKMDKKSYRMIPLANSEDYLYNKDTLRRAREVNPSVIETKQLRFRSWYREWLDDNISEKDLRACGDWFLGVISGSGEEPQSRCTMEVWCGHERNRYSSIATSTEPANHPLP